MRSLMSSVGNGGTNLRPDAKLVQQMLNTHLQQIGLTQPLAVDGRVGPKTVAAIGSFQTKVLKFANADQRVDPQGATWNALSGQGLPAPGAPRPKPGRPANPIDLSTATINSAGAKLIKNAESKGGNPNLQAYVCPAGKLTIGWGHTGSDVRTGMTITTAQAETLFRADVSKFEQAVRGAVKTPVSSNQFSALVSFAFNVGAGAFRDSTLLRKLNSGDYQGAANEFPRWVHGGGKVLPGLVTRRQNEQQLFQTPG